MRKSDGPDPYPGCFIYYQFRQWGFAPVGGLVTINFQAATIRGSVTMASPAGHQAFFEWDAYLGLWREYGCMIIVPNPSGFPLSSNWYSGQPLSAQTLSPAWATVGGSGLVYDIASQPPYAYESLVSGTGSRHVTFDVKKTCFAYQYVNTPQTPGGSKHYWYNKLFSVSITGNARLSAFGTWINGTGYYQAFQNAPAEVDPFNADSGSVSFLVWNTTLGDGTKVFEWIDSGGSVVQETSLYYVLNWDIVPIDATSYTLNYTGTLPDGPESPAGTMNQGLSITASGTMPIRTTPGVTNITSINPVFNLPAGVSSSYFDSTDTSRLVVVPWPQHNLIKISFLDQAVISGGTATYPVEINDIQGRYCYGGFKGSGNTFTMSGYVRMVNNTWQSSVPGQGNRLNTEVTDYRVVNATVTTSVNQANSDDTGVSYDITLTMSFIHNPLYFNTFGTPVTQTNYTFRATTPKLGGPVGSSVIANFTQISATGGPYQNINLGKIEIEILDI